jgi:predicted XRE-type DNA-binding protein
MEIIKSCGNVFLDLGFSPAEAETLRIRAQLMMTLQNYLAHQQLNVTQAAKQFRTTKTTVKKLLDDDINYFTVEHLIGMLVSAGLPVTVKIKPTNLRPEQTGPATTGRAKSRLSRRT